jgi:uncharacterized membrane protein HdeD (DUF308 family)
MIEGFLLGVIVTASLTASAFFFKFWKQTRDKLFLGFSAAFAIEGVNRLAFLFVSHPEEGNPILYTVRLFSFLVILAAIVNKNRA